MTLPPAKLMQDGVLHAVLPPLVAAVVVCALARRLGPAAAALAVAAGWAAGNYFTEVSPWLPDKARVSWLPWVGLAAGVAALAGRVPRVPAGVGWALWAAVVAVMMVKVVPVELHKAPWWFVPAFVLVNAATGPGLAGLSRREPGPWPPLALAAGCFAAAAVLIHAHSARLMEAATVLGYALVGVAAVAAFTKADAGAALPAAGLILSGLMVAGYHETYSNVPPAAFALPAVAPAAALLVPPFRRAWLVRFGLVSALLAAAVYLTASAETLDFENL